jgi:hypothetical protein
VRPRRCASGRRRRLRDPTTGAHVGVCGGGGSAPPPLQWASVAAVPPTLAARLCRRGPSLATALADGCPVAPPHSAEHQTPLPSNTCVLLHFNRNSAAGRSAQFHLKGIYQVYTRYRMAFHDRYMTNVIYLVNDRYMTNIIYLVYTCHMIYVVI